jgi:hypothetical protein
MLSLLKQWHTDNTVINVTLEIPPAQTPVCIRNYGSLYAIFTLFTTLLCMHGLLNNGRQLHAGGHGLLRIPGQCTRTAGRIEPP